MGKRIAVQLKPLTRAFAAVMTLLLAGPLQAQCRADIVELRGSFGTASFRVDVADTAAERSRGLMHVPSMDEDAGMLFIYGRTREAGFWMKNTLIPLDMIFINARGIVHKVHSNARPHDTTTITSDGPIRAVLEINGGVSRQLGIGPGAEIRHPALPQDRAAWPC